MTVLRGLFFAHGIALRLNDAGITMINNGAVIQGMRGEGVMPVGIALGDTFEGRKACLFLGLPEGVRFANLTEAKALEPKLTELHTAISNGTVTSLSEYKALADEIVRRHRASAPPGGTN